MPQSNGTTQSLHKIHETIRVKTDVGILRKNMSIFIHSIGNTIYSITTKTNSYENDSWFINWNGTI